MDNTTHQRLARRWVRIAAAVIVVCVGVLLADYLVARILTPREDKRMKALQLEVRNDASLAPKLAADQKAVTQRRQLRKTRDNRIAWVLIVAAAAFLTCAKRLLPEREVAQASAVAQVSTGAQVSTPASKQAYATAPPAPTAPTPAVAANCSSPSAAHLGSPPAAQAGQSALQPAPPSPPEVEVRFVDEVVAKFGRGAEVAIPLLQAIQSHYRYLPDEALRRLCELTEITPAQVAGTSSFYEQFRRTPVGEHLVRVCHGTACHVAGARQISEELRRHLAIEEGVDTDPQRKFTLTEVACLGCCSLAPVLMVDGHTAGRLTPATACAALKPFEMEKRASREERA